MTTDQYDRRMDPIAAQFANHRSDWNRQKLVLAQDACRDDLSVLYYRMPRLFTALALARGDGRYANLLRSLARVDLLILDDWGPELLEIVEDRYDARSILITSQAPVDRWYEHRRRSNSR